MIAPAPTLTLGRVLLCGSMIVTLSMGIRHGFGLWLQPVTMDRGWTRETFAFAIAVQNIAWGIAGPVAGTRWVTVLHPDGLRSSVGPLATVEVAAGRHVTRGDRLASAAGLLHLGVRRGEQYLDPARLFGARHARLVPDPAR